jgi:uncharacterized protein (DUF2062 family)
LLRLVLLLGTVAGLLAFELAVLVAVVLTWGLFHALILTLLGTLLAGTLTCVILTHACSSSGCHIERRGCCLGFDQTAEESITQPSVYPVHENALVDPLLFRLAFLGLSLGDLLSLLAPTHGAFDVLARTS